MAPRQEILLQVRGERSLRRLRPQLAMDTQLQSSAPDRSSLPPLTGAADPNAPIGFVIRYDFERMERDSRRCCDGRRHRPNLPKGLRNRESQRTRETRWVSAICCAEIDEVPQRHSLLVVHPTTRGMISGPTRTRLASVELIACGSVTVKTAAGQTNAHTTASA